MPKPAKRAANGFTILELLIVLAVAGVIFTIIFNAVPVLIRSSHNNQRRQDVAVILSAISHYQINNSGTSFPQACSTLPNPAGCPDTLLQYTKLLYYDKTISPRFLVVHADKAGQDPSVTSVSGPEGVDIYNFHLCKSGAIGATSAGAGYRDTVAIYDIESSSGKSLECRQL